MEHDFAAYLFTLFCPLFTSGASFSIAHEYSVRKVNYDESAKALKSGIIKCERRQCESVCERMSSKKAKRNNGHAKRFMDNSPTNQLADNPIRRQPTRRQTNSPTNKLAEIDIMTLTPKCNGNYESSALSL